MPFINDAGEPLRVIPLTQAPATGHYFQLNRPIGFRESEASETFWIPAHTPDDDPHPGNRTDLATVPWIFRGFIASYGRQSAPAIMHDYQRQLTSRPGTANQLERAEADDRLFRVALRQQKVPLLRAWLMWAFVSIGRYVQYAPVLAALLLAQTAIGILIVYASVVLAFGSPWWLLGIAVPMIAALAWGRRYVLVLWLTYGFAVIGPLVLLQLLSLAPYWLLELLAREAIDRPFVDPHPGPVGVPFARVR